MNGIMRFQIAWVLPQPESIYETNAATSGGVNQEAFRDQVLNTRGSSHQLRDASRFVVAVINSPSSVTLYGAIRNCSSRCCARLASLKIFWGFSRPAAFLLESLPVTAPSAGMTSASIAACCFGISRRNHAALCGARPHTPDRAFQTIR